MKGTIVITSINQPTEAIVEFSKFNYNMIVVGDKKTPTAWNYKGVTFLGIDRQLETSFSLARELPYNHYCRKMMGYLYAIQDGADFIIDTDDDNIPKKEWGFPPQIGNFEYIKNESGFVNIYELFTDQHIWPRGFPLKYIKNRTLQQADSITKNCQIGIWQGLADDDPDVDAVYRLVINNPCFFNKREPIVLGNGSICPINSQNTLFCKELFPLLYLPSEVTFRFTDILRGLVAQPIMWLYDYYLGFTGATVIQKRNPHDYLDDFISEVPMYINSENIVEIVKKNIHHGKSINDNIFDAYIALQEKGIVTQNELVILEAWLKDLSSIN